MDGFMLALGRRMIRYKTCVAERENNMIILEWSTILLSGLDGVG